MIDVNRLELLNGLDFDDQPIIYDKVEREIVGCALPLVFDSNASFACNFQVGRLQFNDQASVIDRFQQPRTHYSVHFDCTTDHSLG